MSDNNAKIWKAQDGEGWYDENVTTVAANTSQNNYGLTVLASTKVTSIEPPALGVQKTVLFRGSTKAMKLKAGGSATFNNSTDGVLTVRLGTTKMKELGVAVNLVGASTGKWWVLTQPCSTASSTGACFINLSSAT